MAFGGVYIVAGGLTYVWNVWYVPFWQTPLNYLLLICPGLFLLYNGYRLSRTEVPPEFYPTIALWCLGGCGVMVGLLALYHLQPGTSISTSTPVAPILTALSSVAGYGAGIHNARAKELQRTRERLDTTVEQLQTSNERLEQFAYAASHDLQEPLRMISSYLRLLERRSDDKLDEEGREYLEIVVDSADRMTAMVDGLLRYSRVASSDEGFEPVDLEEVLANVRNDLRMKIEDTDTEIAAEPLPIVEGEKDQLQQVFQNLLKNAIEYSGSGPPQIHVSAEPDGPMWIITVRDEGIGIDPVDADSVFELFQRGPNGTDHTGSGIGLALCEQIVERHGGEIWVDSELGEGSAFSFTLPAAPEGDHDA
ncbi:ATP-binding protein [Halalkalicoccus tibetensis]|uniref:histidine kinase n=1 Tax=Halalkalicoccus tibetensis TaxID=175632 RepID=A0ABD5V4T1_9EURY